MPFDLASVLSQAAGRDTGNNNRERIVYIPYSSIVPDAENGYSMCGIEDLARNIEIVGLQQPLRVMPTAEDSSRFRIISGHRRHAAIGKLQDQGSDRFADGVPCIVASAAASEALQELQLLLGNADNRKLTSADEAQQADRISDCIRRLEEEGYEFPGRHRDWVSKLSGMSKSKLSRLSAIKNNLLPELYKKYYLKGQMNETVAYSMSKQPQEVQQELVDIREKHKQTIAYMPEWKVDDFVKSKKRLEALKCKIKKGEPCINQPRILDKIFDGSYSFKPCEHGKCCADCSEIVNCRDRCPLMDEKAKKERAKVREASIEQRKEAKAKEDERIQGIEEVWVRFGQALDAAGIKEEALRSKLKKDKRLFGVLDIYMSKEKKEALLGGSCADAKGDMPLPFGWNFKVEQYWALVQFAKALDVSLDFLFLLSDEPGGKEAIPIPGTTLMAEWTEWKTGTPPADGRYMCLVDLGLVRLHEQKCDWRDGKWFAFGNLIDDNMFTVKAWWPLPPDPEFLTTRDLKDIGIETEEETC